MAPWTAFDRITPGARRRAPSGTSTASKTASKAASPTSAGFPDVAALSADLKPRLLDTAQCPPDYTTEEWLAINSTDRMRARRDAPGRPAHRFLGLLEAASVAPAGSR